MQPASHLVSSLLLFLWSRSLPGLCSLGTSVGGVVYATLQSELIKRFGLDGCLLVVGALALNVVACAGPMRPLTPPRYHSKQCATILEHVAEKQWLQEEKEELSAKDPAIVMETEEQLVRRSLFSCSVFIKMGHYLQWVNVYLCSTTSATEEEENHMIT